MNVTLAARRLCAALLVLGSTTFATAQIPRPLSDWLSTQGTDCPDPSTGCTPGVTPEGTPCCLFVPPARNYVGWTDPRHMTFGAMDYAGLAASAVKKLSNGNKTLPTQIFGSVHERLLPDRRAEVTVILYAKDALSWGNQSLSFAIPPDFGTSAREVLDGKRPALGDVFMHLVFINPRLSARLPDMGQLFFDPKPGEEFKFISFQGIAEGRFRTGGRGLMLISQIGLPDRFPVELVLFPRIGH